MNASLRLRKALIQSIVHGNGISFAEPKGMKLQRLMVLTAILLALVPGVSHAGFLCQFVYVNQSAQVKAMVNEDAFVQWRIWEQTANISRFVKPTASFSVPMSLVKSNLVKVEMDPEVPVGLKRLIMAKPGAIAWLKHPYNRSAVVPFEQTKNVGELKVFYTASRSVILDGPYRGFTLKMGTDHPHGPLGEVQSGKANTSDDVKSAMIHTAHLKKIDQLLGKDSEMVMLPEVVTVSESDSRIGYMIRDVRETDDGHYYLPALSIPYVGRKIAKLNGEKFESFWLKNYAQLLGRAKAKLLLRYALQMETPNAQNMLIQLDRNLKPTGKIVFRDISDSFLVKPVAEGLGFQEQMTKDIAAGYVPTNKFRPFWRNSAWRFDEAGESSVSSETINRWGHEHDRAYVDYVTSELGLKKIEASYELEMMQDLAKLLESSEGQEALKRYREKNQNSASTEPITSPAQFRKAG